MSVRAKFHCNVVSEFATGDKKVSLHPVYPGSDASDEDRAFWAATPNGSLEMNITNKAVVHFFTPGTNYYLTFEKVGE